MEGGGGVLRVYRGACANDTSSIIGRNHGGWYMFMVLYLISINLMQNNLSTKNGNFFAIFCYERRECFFI